MALLISPSLVGEGGAQLLLISCATIRLHGICNGSIDGMEDGGGGGHTLQPHSLGTGDERPPPPQHTQNFPSFLFGTGRGQKVFYPPQPDNRRLTIPSFTSPGHTHSPVCAPTATFYFSRAVMSYKKNQI